MKAISYSGIDFPIRDDVREAHRSLWEHLRRAGSWWSGLERIAIASEVRRAASCPLCQARKAALSPAQGSGAHDSDGFLAADVIDVIHRVRRDPGRLSRPWFEGVMASGIGIGAYVELIGVVAMISGVDYFALSLGTPPFELPQPLPGEPTRASPAAAKSGEAWVPMIAAEDAEDDLYGGSPFVPNIMRALSFVPDEVRMLRALSSAHYVPVEQIPNPLARRDLDRMQMELVAARVSALNQCFY